MANDPFGNTIVTDFETVIAMSPGTFPNVTAGRAQGYVATSATTSIPVRGTTYSAPSSGAQRSISSSSTNDVNSTGTGAWSVVLTYLDSTFAVHQETLLLNGTTAVTTVGTDVHYIESMVVNQVGTGGINAGVITLWTNTSGGGGAIWSIAIGDQQTWGAHHYVPSGVTCYIFTLNTGANAVAGTCSLIHQPNLQTANAPTTQVGVSVVHPVGQWDHEFLVPIVLPGPDLAYVIDQPQAATANRTVAGFEYLQF
jgi:hypothetical protein